jgi:hypothetical protein
LTQKAHNTKENHNQYPYWLELENPEIFS